MKFIGDILIINDDERNMDNLVRQFNKAVRNGDLALVRELDRVILDMKVKQQIKDRIYG